MDKKIEVNLGTIVLTKAIKEIIEKDENFKNFVMKSLERHRRGDWGDLVKEDWEENNFSLDKELRLLSSYKEESRGNKKIWIITEADRGSTCVLFPDEY